MGNGTRRQFMSAAAAAAAAKAAMAQLGGERPPRVSGVEVLHPRARTPVSLIIDDSTCLVNLNRFAFPQFASVGKDQWGRVDWRSMPHEIPDDFVRRFGEWAAENGVKGKYSIVPYPALVGRLDRELPGWTPQEVKASIDLVRELMVPNWDIHPEMVTHTRVIDLKTGQPYPARSVHFMENWRWSDEKSVDELAAYISYALRILRNIDLPCEGVTSPGGFGARVRPEYAKATLEACREVFSAEIPHYFQDVISSGEESVAPRVYYASDLAGSDPKCVVSIIGCTGDWTGGWDAVRTPEPDRFITKDLSKGRLVDVIERGEPALLVCHWTGIYYNGRELGFQAFQEVVRRLHEKYDNLIWMKNSEIARYWAARELTRIEPEGATVKLRAPFACPSFTLRIAAQATKAPAVVRGRETTPLREVGDARRLEPGTWLRGERETTVCFDLGRGRSEIRL